MKARLTNKVDKKYVEFYHPDEEGGAAGAEFRDGQSIRAVIPKTYWLKNEHETITLNGCRFVDLAGIDDSIALLRAWRSDNANLEWKTSDRWLVQSVTYTVVQRDNDKIVHAVVNITLIKNPKVAVFIGVKQGSKITSAKLTKKEVAQKKTLNRKGKTRA